MIRFVGNRPLFADGYGLLYLTHAGRSQRGSQFAGKRARGGQEGRGGRQRRQQGARGGGGGGVGGRGGQCVEAQGCGKGSVPGPRGGV